jgi:hypothetical protein
MGEVTLTKVLELFHFHLQTEVVVDLVVTAAGRLAVLEVLA